MLISQLFIIFAKKHNDNQGEFETGLFQTSRHAKPTHMKIKSFLTAAIAAGAMSASAAGTIPVIPLPADMNIAEGAFTFTPSTGYRIIGYPNDSVEKVMQTMLPELEAASMSDFTPAAEGAALTLSTNPGLGEEAYTLSVTPQSITIEASRPAGFFYALQTLRQILPYGTVTSQPSVPVVEITDSPRFGWRGFMLDEGRHMFGKDEVKKILDLMASYKMNRFHWHLTEDQGWRIEIKKYPDLTGKGAFRSSTSLGWGDVIQPDTIAYGGFYTQDDIREIVAYARERFIEIVPEIDIPGHTQAAVAAYPELLACDPENPHEVWLQQGVSRDVMNVANPAAVQMAKDIIDEITPLFPFPYLHLGGDECPTDKWKENAQCQALLDSIGSDKFRDLQLNFYRELTDHIATKPESEQRKLIFWNEVLHGNTSMLPDDITIMAWVGADKAAAEAAGRGLTTILTPQIPYYINRKQSTLATEPYTQGRGTETLEAVYNYVPMKDVPAQLHDKYLGVQANFWSEYVIDPKLLEYLTLPRLAAVAEAGWTPQSARDYKDFRNRVRAQQPMYDAKGLNYGRHEFMNE